MPKLFFTNVLVKKSFLPFLERPLMWFEAIITQLLMWFLRLLPPEASARLMGYVLRWLGPRTTRHRWVLGNLTLALPDASSSEIQRLAKQNWQHLGYLLGELPHFRKIMSQPQCIRWDNQWALPKPPEQRQQCIYVTPHMGNWELLIHILKKIDTDLVLLRSPLSNKGLNGILQRFRKKSGIITLDKTKGVRPIVRELIKKRSLLIATDIRVESGKPIPFFHHDMQTTTLPARLAWRFGCDLITWPSIRLAPARFSYGPLTTLETLPRQQTSEKEWVLDTTRRLNQQISKLISQQPESWLCTNRRWAKSLYADV